MNERRPGGLTALAVFNFIWALMVGLGSLNYVFAMTMSDVAAQLGLDAVGAPILIVLFATSLGAAALLVVSGIGYLGCRPIAGLGMGLAYAAVSVCGVALKGWALGRIGVDAIGEAIYPALTAALLLTTFRRDFLGAPSPAELGDAPADEGRPASHLGLLARAGVRNAIRNGSGVIFLILIVVVGVQTAGGLLANVEKNLRDSGMEKEAGQVAKRVLDSESIRGTIEGLSGQDEEQVRFLMSDKPALLSAFFLIMMVITPFSACLGGFNQTAGDIGTRGLRYLLLRTERRNVFHGRFLGTLSFSCGAMAFLVVIFLVYVQVGIGAYGADLWTWGLQGLLALCLLALPHLALCAWVSGASNGPFVALAVSLMAMAMPLVIVKAGIAAFAAGLDVELDWLERLLPWGWKYELLSRDVGRRLLASFVMLGFAGAFLWLGGRHFRRRDL